MQIVYQNDKYFQIMFSDEYFMKKALEQANMAMEKGEIPVGAVVTFNNKIIAQAYNYTQQLNDVTAHAEMQAFTSASNNLGGKYLTNCTLFVTLEPCVMCGGAAYWTQVSRIVFGASDPKKGISSLQENILHPKTEIVGGVLEKECSAILLEFFKSKRQ